MDVCLHIFAIFCNVLFWKHCGVQCGVQCVGHAAMQLCLGVRPFHGILSRWKLKPEDVDSLTRASHKDLRALARLWQDADAEVAKLEALLKL